MSRPEANLSCRRARVLLEAYVDGDLRGPRRAAMDTHLAGCHACSQEFMRARQIRGALRDLPPQACSEAVLESVRRRLGAAAAAVPPVAATSAVPATSAPQPRSVAARLASRNWGERLAGWWNRHMPGWQPAMVFGSVGAVVLVGFLILHRPQHEQAVTAEDLRRADAQVRWVLATLGHINERTGERVRTEVFEKGVAEPTIRAVNGAIENSVAQ